MAAGPLVILSETRTETVVNRSRFIGLARPAGDAAAAEDAMTKIRLAFPDASHHCFAWRAGPGHERLSDDGEPQGTAGAPLLESLRRAKIEFGVVAVVRYYGGRKLGRAGLYRAYLGAARSALTKAELAERIFGHSYRVRLAHQRHPAFLGALGAVQGEVIETAWGEAVEITYWLPDDEKASSALGAQLAETAAATLLGPEMRHRARAP